MSSNEEIVSFFDNDKPGSSYFMKLSQNDNLLSKNHRDYYNHRLQEDPRLTPRDMTKEWNSWKNEFQNSKIKYLETISSKQRRFTKRDFKCLESDNRIGGSDFLEMRREYEENFHKWDSQSKHEDLEKELFEITKNLQYESPLHSFIILNDKIDAVLDNSETLSKLVSECDSRVGVKNLEEWQGLIIKRFSGSYKLVEDVIGQGWTFCQKYPADHILFAKRVYWMYTSLFQVYCSCDGILPLEEMESWYSKNIWHNLLLGTTSYGSGRVKLKPGEVNSQSSSWRKNILRTPDERFSTGRKFDSLFASCTIQQEICAVEIKKRNQGSNSTPSQTDQLKLAKVMKDMYDYALINNSRHPDQLKKELVIYGLKFSGLKVEFLALRHLTGRYYRQTLIRSLQLPITWQEVQIATLIKEFSLLSINLENTEKTISSPGNINDKTIDDELFGKTQAETIIVRPLSIHSLTFTTPINTPPNSPKLKKIASTSSNIDSSSQ